MTTVLGPSATTTRQPFGVLDTSQLRSLQSVKNRQNAIAPLSAQSLKRRHASPDASDGENVAPESLKSVSKRQRATFGDDITVSKAARYSLDAVSKSTIKSHVEKATTVTPRLDTFQRSLNTPASAPAAAGRSPPNSKPHGLLGPRKRFVPPSFGTKGPSLSITAALNGTLAQKRPKKVRTLEETKPKSWFFDIFEESQEQQDYKMNEWTMTQSAIILDISDDESKARTKADRGKENVDPNEISMPVTRSMAAAQAAAPISVKGDRSSEARSPLSDLNPSDYFGEGLDATSVILVNDTADDPVEEESASTQPSQKEVPPQDESHVDALEPVMIPKDDEHLSTAEISALLMAAAPAWDTETLVCEDVADRQESSGDLEIWESESAKDENENTGEESIFALQEL